MRCAEQRVAFHRREFLRFATAGVIDARASAASLCLSSADHADRLWLLMNLELWQRIFIDGDDPSAALGDARRPCGFSG